MFALILIVIVGLGIALFAQQNVGAVSVSIGPYAFAAVPVYIVVLLSMLLGLFIAWIMSVMDFFSHSLHMRRKDSAIHTAERRVSGLEHEVAELREENARLKGEVHTTDMTHEHHGDETPRRGFIEQMRERLAHHTKREALS